MLTILIPTFEEKDNILPITKALSKILNNINHQIIFIDDNSNDGSILEFKKIKMNYQNTDYILRNSAQRDLTLSVLEGLSHVKTDYLCLTDCDLQHDITKIPIMLEKIISEDYDLVVGSRFKNKNDSKIELSLFRTFNSKLGILLSKLLGINDVKDPLSGFFIIKTNILKSIQSEILTRGFKILLTLLFLKNKQLKIYEIQTNFFSRKKGISKLNLKNKLIFCNQVFYLIKLKFKFFKN